MTVEVRADVISDLSFLTMDLQAHGRADLAFVALDAYLQMVKENLNG